MHKHDGENLKITRGEESRGSNRNPWDLNLESDQANSGGVFSEKIPEVWKSQTFTGTPFSIEKCRDLK